MQKRSDVLKAIRQAVSIDAYRTFSDKRKNSQRVKLYGVIDSDRVFAEIQEFVKSRNLQGIELNISYDEIVLNFDNAFYCK